jgi:flagellin
MVPLEIKPVRAVPMDILNSKMGSRINGTSPGKASGTDAEWEPKGNNSMALSILNNIASLAAQNQLGITNSNLKTALFQLSSGSRINSGADDAAGLAVADGLQANITALTQSARNANDGVGSLQVADGALAQVTTLLNRAVTLATESSTGTISNTQRTALDTEFTSIKAEIDSIGANTNYNGTAVFTSTPLNVYLSDANSSSTISTTTGALSALGVGLGANASNTLSAIANATTTDTVTVGSGAGQTYTLVTALTASTTANQVLIGATTAATLANLAAAVNGGPGAGVAYGSATVTNADVTALAGASTVAFTAKVAGSGGNALVSTTTDASFGFSNAATFSGGAGSAGLTTASAAQAALTTINSAVQTIAALRGTLGASVNRLQAASNVINNQVQNLTGAEDSVRAADIPSTVAALAKFSILEQTGISALSQANQQQQLVLKLLQ